MQLEKVVEKLICCEQSAYNRTQDLILNVFEYYLLKDFKGICPLLILKNCLIRLNTILFKNLEKQEKV